MNEFVQERIDRQQKLMLKHDIQRIVADQQELLAKIRPVATVAEQIFNYNPKAIATTGDNSDIVSSVNDGIIDDQTEYSLGANASSHPGDYTTDNTDMASVNSAEDLLRDILSEQLVSVEEQKEKVRQERILAAENASSKYFVTHNYTADGHKIFEAIETKTQHGDKLLPIMFVKKQSLTESVLYK